MFRRRTLLVVGAGASFEVGLPTGDTLRSRIASMLYFRFPDGYNRKGGDDYIYETLRQHAHSNSRNINDYLHAARAIHDGLPLAISIDNFLEAHEHDELINLCGKLAIAKSIASAERSSKLYFDPHRSEARLNTTELEGTWYVKLMYALCEGVPRNQIREAIRNLSIVCFNYDRCIEFFLTNAIATYYKMPLAEVAAMLTEDLTIIHPYGTVGILPEFRRGNESSLGFGDSESLRLLDAAAGIKTFTESVPRADKLQELVEQSETVVFLGFSYLRQNLRLLTCAGGLTSRSRRIFGTTFGLSKVAVEEIAGELKKVFAKKGRGGLYPQEHVALSDETCERFLVAYQRTLTA